MKHFQKWCKSGLQALKTQLGQFLLHVWERRIKQLKFLQWQSMDVYDFSIVKDRIHWEIINILGIIPKPIPHPGKLRINFSQDKRQQSSVS